MRRSLALLALVLALGACGSNPKQATTQATTTTVAPTTTEAPDTPEGAFLQTVKSAGFGDVDMEDPSNDEPLVSIAKDDVCGMLDNPVAGYGDVAQVLIETKKHPTGEQVKTYVRAAVENFCPRNVDKLPPS
jgi:hypothetical protein